MASSQVLIKAPNHYSPFVDKERSLGRRSVVLQPKTGYVLAMVGGPRVPAGGENQDGTGEMSRVYTKPFMRFFRVFKVGNPSLSYRPRARHSMVTTVTENV